MRRIFAVLFVLLVSIGSVLPVFAANGDFAPSIEYKDGPTVVSGFLGEEEVTKCLVVTTVLTATNSSTDVSGEVRQRLLGLYEQLTREQDPMKLPLEHDYTVLELIDISYHYSTCPEGRDHGYKDTRGGSDNIMLTIALKLNVPLEAGANVLAYDNGQWRVLPFETLEDGAISFVVEKTGPVAITVPQGYIVNPPQTGDQIGNNLVLWVTLMTVSAAALVAVAVLAKRKVR